MSWMKSSEALAKLPEIFIQGRLSFNFDGIPLIAEQLSIKKKMNLNPNKENLLAFRLKTVSGLS